MKNIQKLLANSSLKITPQRLAILKEIDKMGHASIEEIYENVNELFPSISLATIYKNINALKNENIISEIPLHQKVRYEITKKPHAHFICKKCSSIEDVPLKDIVKRDINKRYPDSQKEIYIYGICQKCKENKN